MRTWMPGFKILEKIHKALRVMGDNSTEELAAQRDIKTELDNFRETIETMNQVMAQKVEAMAGSLNRFVNLNQEMIALMAKYFQYEIDAIEEQRKTLASEDRKPTEQDLRF